MLLLLISCSHSLTKTKKIMVQSSTTLTLFVLMLQNLNCPKEGKTNFNGAQRLWACCFNRDYLQFSYKMVFHY